MNLNKKLIIITFSVIFLTFSVKASEECFEKTSRAIFKFNMGFDRIILKPVAKGYNKLPNPIKQGTGNFTSNLGTLLTIPNHLLQAQWKLAGESTASFLINSTVGVLGFANPAAKMGLKNQQEDVGQTLGSYGMGPGCYFVLPILGPTTARDAVGLIGNTFLDPVYQITHNTEIANGVVGNGNYSEHNYYYYRGTGAVDFRAKNIEPFNSLKNNSIDLYASVKSLYLQDRQQKILNSKKIINTQNDSDWEEVESQ